MCQGYDDHIYRYRFLLYYFERSINILIFISLLFMLLAFMSFKLKIFNLFTGHLNWNINILFQMKYSQKPPIPPPPAKKEKKNSATSLCWCRSKSSLMYWSVLSYISLNYSRNFETSILGGVNMLFAVAWLNQCCQCAFLGQTGFFFLKQFWFWHCFMCQQ